MSTYDEASPSSGRHPVNVGHLVMGIALIGLVAVWALVKADLVADETIRFLLPMPWVLGGVGGLIASTVASRRRAAERSRDDLR
ncbi:hypothetical protein [Nocardioides ochotonae]|uniref:hypothetical protein n=1 Tax=Nocardioides ochotonae TaxID=2685869 RepID=UPI00140C8C78|nr:hypothetical protein [Nocardioides ochotonae]